MGFEERLKDLERRVRRLEGEAPVSPRVLWRENLKMLNELADVGWVRYGRSSEVRAVLQRLVSSGLVEADPSERVRITEAGLAMLKRIEDDHQRVRDAYSESS